jgi:hypothetical protein
VIVGVVAVVAQAHVQTVAVNREKRWSVESLIALWQWLPMMRSAYLGKKARVQTVDGQ